MHPNGHVRGVRWGGRAPNTNNTPIWARKRCLAGWKGPKHQQRAQMGTLLLFGGEGMQLHTKMHPYLDAFLCLVGGRLRGGERLERGGRV